MSFEIPNYYAPDFTLSQFVNAPDVRWEIAPKDGVVASIAVAQGTAVEAGATLCTIQ